MTYFEGGIQPGTVLKTEFGARPPTSVGEILQMSLFDRLLDGLPEGEALLGGVPHVVVEGPEAG